jgi:hypothetical protein
MGNDPKANTSTTSAVVNEQAEQYKWKITDKVSVLGVDFGSYFGLKL